MDGHVLPTQSLHCSSTDVGEAAWTQTPAQVSQLSGKVDHAAACTRPTPAAYTWVETATTTGAVASFLI